MNKRTLILPPLALIGLWAAAIWWPAQSSVAAEQDRLVEIQSQQLALIAEFDDLDAAADQLDALNAEVASMEVAIPPAVGISSFIQQLNAEAVATGLQIDLLAPTLVLGGPATDPDRPIAAGISSVSLSVTGQGSFEAAMAFVDRLMTLPRLIVVDELGLTSVEGDTGQVIINLDIRIFTTEQMTGNTVGSSAIATGVDPGSASELEIVERVREVEEP